jgi:hypothetical protein
MEAKSKPMYQPWNEEEFQADVFVRGMTWLQRHLYRSLLCAAFFHGTRPYLPSDDEVLWVLAGAESPDMWEQNKARVLKRFTVCEHDASLLENKRVTADWNRLLSFRDEAAEQGRLGGLKSAEARKEKYGTARPFKPLVVEPVEPIGNTPSESFTENVGTRNQVKLSEEKLSEVKKREENTCNANGISCSQAKTADWKNIAIPYRNVFGKKAGADFKKRYFDACLKFGEDVVLECFHAWATQNTADWCETNGFDRPLNLFFKKLPEEAEDTIGLNQAEKEINEKAAEVRRTGDEIQAASIEKQTADLVALLDSRDVKRESEGSLEDFMASVEENG